MKGAGGGRAALDTAGAAAATATGGLFSADMAQERERRAWERDVESSMRKENAALESAETRRGVSFREEPNLGLPAVLPTTFPFLTLSFLPPHLPVCR